MGFGRARSAWCHSICQAIFTEIFPLYRIFKTPGLRTPAARERIYNVSVNGSPLADSKEVFLTVPVGGGEVSVLVEGLVKPQCAAYSPFLSLVHHPFLPRNPKSFGCLACHLITSVELRTISSPRLELQTEKILAQLWVPFVHQLT